MSPSLLERMSFRKALNKVPAAACWDYAEIPLSSLVDKTKLKTTNKII
jgi:hypothetical protein